MAYCERCGSPGIDTLSCHIYGSCRMHDTHNDNRRREEDRQQRMGASPNKEKN